ncbi:MAG TPA: hypothetical protein DCS28_03795 [Candidatus Moranbacteria bacterium]|nr:hypothetical protein [Candidatus Moranbacteria bacterium]HAT75134.1 hypothetical protein [Candidatus Moranbacteria bacterium]
MNTENKIEFYFFPIVATYGNESSASILAKWDKLDTLSETNKGKLTSQKTAEVIKRINYTFNLNPEQISIVAITVRSYYFGEIALEDMPFYLAKEIPIDLAKAKEISQMIIQKIINDDSQEKAYQSQLEKLPIEVAVKRYPETGEQLITSDYIKLKSFFEPVRPSIKNWLSDYTFNIGISNHDPIVRGNYLFKNENAQKLSAQDRDKLSQILKSFEEKTPLAINTNTRQVVFSTAINQERPVIKPSFAESALDGQSAPRQNYPSEKPQTFQSDEERLSAWRQNLPLKETLENNNNTNQSGANNIRFSSTQKFSVEKPTVKNNFQRPMPKNVIDLRKEE